MKIFEIKICGLTRIEDAECAVELGATALGMIFTPSPRMASVEFALEVAHRFPQIQRVGIVQDLAVDDTAALTQKALLTAIQFHGRESVDHVSAFRSLTSATRIIRALNVDAALSAKVIESWAAVADTLLFDSPRAQSARSPLDLSLLTARLEQSPQCQSFWIAGGLTSDSVEEKMFRVLQSGLALGGIDVSSGVESAPGIKDSDELKKFISNARKCIEKTKGASRASK